LKSIFLVSFFLVSQIAFAKTDIKNSENLITDALELGCGWSDLVYEDLSQRLREKHTSGFDLKTKGSETTRRLSFYSDSSWFLTLEFFNSGSVKQDITCIVAHGPGETSEVALNFEVTKFPDWKWGRLPEKP
jgi:hypothetical protein